MAAMLADIRASAFYPLTVRYAEQTLSETLQPSSAKVKNGRTVCNCTSILALVSSTKASQKKIMNEQGTTVTTTGVKDLLASDGREYTLTAHCTTDTHMDFMLTPSKRSKQQDALVVLRGTLDESNSDTSAEQPVHNFLVESILPLHDDDAKVAKASLLKFIPLIALAGQAGGEKRENSGWSEDASPAKIAKCRSMTRYLTGTKSQHIPSLSAIDTDGSAALPAPTIATYMVPGSATQPAVQGPTHKLAFYNVGWLEPSQSTMPLG